MGDIKTRGIRNIERKMEDVSEDSMRYKALESARDFKTSWIGLGQTLFTVWKDKLYKEWGYQEFETYALKEIGIQKQTALKLLKSYSFLEKEEPLYLERNLSKEAEPAVVPTYESVDVLRLAKDRKDLDTEDYARVRKYVLEEGKDAGYVKKDLACIIKERSDIDPDELAEKKRLTLLKRLLSVLRSVKTELKASKNLPQGIMKEVDALIRNVEQEVSG
jgi:hypothetical protein